LSQDSAYIWTKWISLNLSPNQSLD
jgi:hypothetical protein